MGYLVHFVNSSSALFFFFFCKSYIMFVSNGLWQGLYSKLLKSLGKPKFIFIYYSPMIVNPPPTKELLRLLSALR